MSLFGNLTTDGLEESQDRLGGFKIFETDAYPAVIKMAYAGQSANSKARSITLIADLTIGGSTAEYKTDIWITNKEDKNFYVDQDKKHQPLAGFTLVNDICQVTCNGKELSAMATQEKVVNIYNYDSKKDEPKAVPMLVELLGKPVILGIQKQKVNKQKKDGNGVYQDTAEEREVNELVKVFHSPSTLTVVEARRGIQVGEFYKNWVERNKGVTRDRRTVKDGNGGNAGRSGRPNGATPPKAAETAAKATSLFN